MFPFTPFNIRFLINPFWYTGLLQRHGYTIPFQNEQSASGLNGHKRRRIMPAGSPDRLLPRTVSVDIVHTGVAPANSPTSPTISGFPVTQPLAFVDHSRSERVTAQQSSAASPAAGFPDAKHLPSIFPPHICRSIVKTAAKAEVEVTPSQNANASCLKLSIYSTKVQYLARELFGVDIDNEGGRMFVRFESGASAQVDTLRLTGARLETLEKCFGPTTTAVIQSSSRYLAELAQGQITTDCVSFVIQGCTGLHSLLSLESDPDSFSTITTRLWPPGYSP